MTRAHVDNAATRVLRNISSLAFGGPEGRTLFAKNPEEERAPASLVKLMTLYLAFEDIEAHRAELEHYRDTVALAGGGR